MKGGSVDRLTRKTADGITIKPLYREADWSSASDPLGVPGDAPFLRGAAPMRDAFLPWDIRQAFAHPDPAQTNKEILRDLERGVSSIEILVDPRGEKGCAAGVKSAVQAALNGVQAGIATVSMVPIGAEAGYGLETSILLAEWANEQGDGAAQKLAFNLCPLSAFARLGTLEESLESAFARTAKLAGHLSDTYSNAHLFRIDARAVHETGGSDAQELAALIADGIDTLRRLDAAGMNAETCLLYTSPSPRDRG